MFSARLFASSGELASPITMPQIFLIDIKLLGFLSLLFVKLAFYYFYLKIEIAKDNFVRNG